MGKSTEEVIKLKLDIAEYNRNLDRAWKKYRKFKKDMAKGTSGEGGGIGNERMVRTSPLGKARTALNLVSSGVLGFGLGAAMGNLARVFNEVISASEALQRRFLQMDFGRRGARAAEPQVQASRGLLSKGLGASAFATLYETLPILDFLFARGTGSQISRDLQLVLPDELVEPLKRLADSARPTGEQALAEFGGGTSAYSALLAILGRGEPGAGSVGLARGIAAREQLGPTRLASALATDELRREALGRTNAGDFFITTIPEIQRREFLKAQRSAKQAITLEELAGRSP